MSRRRGFVEQFARDPMVRDAAARIASEWLMPNISDFTRDAVRAFRFPRCSALHESMIPNVQLPHGGSCQAHGVGHCRNCRQPFCHDHGLLFLSGVLDPTRMMALVDQQVPGLCTRCIDAMTLFVQQAQAQPPPRPVEPPRQYEPPVGGVPPSADLPPKVRQAYAILGLSHGATMTEIKKAQRGLAAKYHPDRPGTSAEDMVIVNEAVATLDRFLSGRGRP